MKNITVAVSDRANRDARVWAARRDTSLSKIVQNFLESLPSIRSARALAASESDSAKRNETGSQPGARPHTPTSRKKCL
ncbi:MAG TPA: hypothetical protein VK720_06305 [Terracidiphilus sp.]|nr:hypothetical protein [Terracidiphilus sp.]